MDRIVQDAQRMLSERRRLLLGTLQEQSGEDVGTADDEARDRIAAAAESEVRHRLADRELAELKEIDSALRRIEQGTYGRCERCNHAIGKQRLRAVPEARLCLDCGSGRVATRPGA